MTILRAPAAIPQQQAGVFGTIEPSIPEKLIKPWKLPPQRTYVFKNARVINPLKHSPTPLTTVTVRGGTIELVGSSCSSLSTDDTETIDLEGRYLCPGLIDCHVHITAVAGDASLSGAISSADQAPSHFRQSYLCGQMLSRGFTTIRDTGGGTLALKEALEDEVFPGPRLFTANKALSQTGGHGDTRGTHDVDQGCCSKTSGISVVVDGVAECTRAAREQLRTGGDFIKIMSGGGVASPTDRLENTQFTAKEIQAISEVAESFGTWVTAHAYTPKAIRHAVDNGVTGIEHGNMIDKETAAYMAERKIWLTPTLVTYDAMGSDKYAGFLPPANKAKNQAVLQAGLDSLRIAHAAGVMICHGSDLLGPLQAEQSREFEIRSQALSSTTILQGATVNAAKMLRQDNFLGQIKAGFAADMLILNKNPHEDISILSKPEKNVLAVIKNGRVYVSRWSKLSEDIHQPTSMIE